MTDTPTTDHACGWTVTQSAVGHYRPSLLLPNHTCHLAVLFSDEAEAWAFINDVILPRASAKVVLKGWRVVDD